jgi:hypothetical protein
MSFVFNIPNGMKKLTVLSAMLLFFLQGLIMGQEVTCETSQPFCTGNIYTYPAGTSGSAEPGAYYGCLSTQPAPAWFHMLIKDSGSITIYMYSTPLVDIDFICWGPFTDPVEPCLEGLTAGNTIDCSYSPNPTEYCDIPEGETGQYYILLITNYSQQPAEITFSQTAGTGSLDCSYDWPDLIVQNPNVDPVSNEPGDSVFTSCVMTNQGNGDAGSSYLRYYLSSDTLFDNGDLELGSDSIGNIGVDQSISQNETLVIPSNTTAGSWFILYFADADNQIEELDENNNLNFIQILIDSTTTINPDPSLPDFKVKVYPNPAKSQLFIDFSGINDSPLSIEMLNSLGLTISTFEISTNDPDIISLNLDKLPSGTYFLRIKFATALIFKMILIAD